MAQTGFTSEYHNIRTTTEPLLSGLNCRLLDDLCSKTDIETASDTAINGEVSEIPDMILFNVMVLYSAYLVK